MNIGGIQDRLLFYRPVKSIDPTTRLPVTTYVQAFRAWGKYTPLEGTEPFLDAQRQGKFDAEFETRFRDDITVEWRIKTPEGRLFNIYSVTPGGYHNRERLTILGLARAE